MSASPIDSPTINDISATSHSAGHSFAVVRIVLGVLLLSTAGLKLLDPSPDTIGGLGLFLSPRRFMAAVYAEALFGIWMLTGAVPKLLWQAALFGFSLLACVSLYLGIEGQPSCGCFGAKLPVSPWYALALDLAAVGALAWWRPIRVIGNDAPYSVMLRRFFVVGAGAGLILLLGLGGLAWWHGSFAVGFLRLRGEIVTCHPSLSDLGEGIPGETKHFSIMLENRSTSPIRIIGGSSNCSCVATENMPMDIRPNGVAVVEVRVRYGLTTGTFYNVFSLQTDSEAQPIIKASFKGSVLGVNPE